MKLFGLLSLVTLTLLSMSCSKKVMVDEKEMQYTAISAIAGEILDGKSECLPNGDESLFLCSKTEEVMISFIVLDPEGMVIYQKQKIRGRVTWHANDALAVWEHPAVLRDRFSEADSTMRIIQLQTGKR